MADPAVPIFPIRSDSLPPVRSSPGNGLTSTIAKKDFERLTSQTLHRAASEPQGRSHASSPLDSINPNLFVRFPRFSMTTEISSPNLSTEEVTSTRLSLDEEELIRKTTSPKTPKDSRLNLKIQRAVSSSSIKRLGDSLRIAPSTILSRKSSSRSPAFIEDLDAAAETPSSELSRRSSRAHQGQSTITSTATHSQSTSPAKSSNTGEKRKTLTRIKRGSMDFLSNTYKRLSSLHDLRSKNGSQISLEDTMSSRFPQPLQLDAFNHSFGLGPSLTSLNSYHTARDASPDLYPSTIPYVQVSDFNRSTSFATRRSVPRSISLGSIDELRTDSYTAYQQRAFTVPSIPSRTSSIECLTACKPRSRPVSVCDVEHYSHLAQLREDPLFVDLQENCEVDFVLPTESDVFAASTTGRRPLHSKARSYRSLRQVPNNTPLLVRSTSIKDLPKPGESSKVPLYVPSQIIVPPARKSSRLASFPGSENTLRTVGSLHETSPKSQRGHSREALTNSSAWSTKVQLGAQHENPSGDQSIEARQTPALVSQPRDGLVCSAIEKEADAAICECDHLVEGREENTENGETVQVLPQKTGKRSVGTYLKHLFHSFIGRQRSSKDDKAVEQFSD